MMMFHFIAIKQVVFEKGGLVFSWWSRRMIGDMDGKCLYLNLCNAHSVGETYRKPLEVLGAK